MANDGSSARSIVNAKTIVVGILLVIVIALAIANSQKVKLDFIVSDVKLPLFLVIIGSAVVGWIVGFFMGRRE